MPTNPSSSPYLSDRYYDNGEMPPYAEVARRYSHTGSIPADVARLAEIDRIKAEVGKYNPDQPRVPAGEPGGGQFGSGDGGSAAADDFASAGFNSGRGLTPTEVKYWNKTIGMNPAQFKDQSLKGLDKLGTAHITARVDWMADGLRVGVITSSDAGKPTMLMDQVYSRASGSLSVDLAHLEFSEDFQQQGIGKTVLDNSMRMYKQMGVDNVTLYADISTGAYAWAKYGFTPTQSSWDALRAGTRDLAEFKSLPHPARTAVDKILSSNDPRGVWALSDIKLPYNDTTVGKALLLGRPWDGVLDLHNTEQMARFNRYVGHHG